MQTRCARAHANATNTPPIRLSARRATARRRRRRRRDCFASLRDYTRLDGLRAVSVRKLWCLVLLVRPELAAPHASSRRSHSHIHTTTRVLVPFAPPRLRVCSHCAAVLTSHGLPNPEHQFALHTHKHTQSAACVCVRRVSPRARRAREPVVSACPEFVNPRAFEFIYVDTHKVCIMLVDMCVCVCVCV